MKTVKNQRGASLVGAMIAAGIGLVVTLGISKGLINFADQTTKMKRTSDIGLIKQNLTAKLRDPNMWLQTLAKSRAANSNCVGSAPGRKNNCPIVLYKKDSAAIWMCRKRGGTSSQGVVILDKAGNEQDLNCGTCRNKDNCGYPTDKYSRVVFNDITFDSNLNMDSRPSFKDGAIEDTAGTKTKDGIEVANSSSDIYDETQVSCPAGTYLEQVKDGKPQCVPTIDVIKQKGCKPPLIFAGFNQNGIAMCVDPKQYTGGIIRNIGCPAGSYLEGFNNSGAPVCKPVSQLVRGNGCRNGEYLQGFDNNGNRICRRLDGLMNTVQCGSGQVARGIYSNGRPICVSLSSYIQPRTNTWTHSCDKCNRTTNLGRHFYCGLTKFASGGWNSSCVVNRSGSNWSFNITDHDNNDQTTSCKATCVDF